MSFVKTYFRFYVSYLLSVVEFSVLCSFQSILTFHFDESLARNENKRLMLFLNFDCAFPSTGKADRNAVDLTEFDLKLAKEKIEEGYPVVPF